MCPHSQVYDWQLLCVIIILIIIIIIKPRQCLWCCHHDQSHCESSRGLSERWVAANPQTKPIKLAATVHIHRRHCYYYSSISWYSFFRSAKSGRLSRPRHCSVSVQPMPKAVYCSGCRDKHNRLLWDSNFVALTPQSHALTTRLLGARQLVLCCVWRYSSMQRWSETRSICITRSLRWVATRKLGETCIRNSLPLDLYNSVCIF